MEVYECVSCKKLTEGFPTTLRRKCLVCRNLELEMRYRKHFFDSFSKKELADCHRELIQKLKVEEDYSDGLSENDNDSDDIDFVPPTPQHKGKSKNRKRKLFTTRQNQKSKRCKHDHQNKDNGSDHESNQIGKSDQEFENESERESEQESGEDLLKIKLKNHQKTLDKSFHLQSISKATNFFIWETHLIIVFQ